MEGAPPGGQDILQAPGKAPVGREPHPQAAHSSSPGSAGAPALGLVGTLPRCLWHPQLCERAPGLWRNASASRLPGATPSPRHRLALVWSLHPTLLT